MVHSVYWSIRVIVSWIFVQTSSSSSSWFVKRLDKAQNSLKVAKQINKTNQNYKRKQRDRSMSCTFRVIITISCRIIIIITVIIINELISGPRRCWFHKFLSKISNRNDYSVKQWRRLFSGTNIQSWKTASEEVRHRRSGVTRVGVTRGGNWRCHPYFSL